MPKTPEITEAIKALRAIDAVETARAREAIKAIKAIKTAGTARTLDAIKALRASKGTAPAAKAPKAPKATGGATQIQKPARVADRLLTQLGSRKHPISAAELVESLQCSMASVSLALRDLQAQGEVVKVRTGRQIQYTLA